MRHQKKRKAKRGPRPRDNPCRDGREKRETFVLGIENKLETVAYAAYYTMPLLVRLRRCQDDLGCVAVNSGATFTELGWVDEIYMHGVPCNGAFVYIN
jgi:hypothetical protein